VVEPVFFRCIGRLWRAVHAFKLNRLFLGLPKQTLPASMPLDAHE
jgi:hypothetical protein